MSFKTKDIYIEYGNITLQDFCGELARPDISITPPAKKIRYDLFQDGYQIFQNQLIERLLAQGG